MSRDVFAGGGETGTLMRSMDWSATPLGPVSSWSQALRTTVSTSLNAQIPIQIWWGPELITLYNDASRELVAGKHPGAMGARGRDVWPDRWDVLGPMLEGVLSDGKATSSENQELLPHRSFTSTFSPIRDESGEIAGVFCAATETTSAQALEEARRQLARNEAELEQANTLRDEFLTVASHELRTPLTTLGLQVDGVLHVLKQAGPHDLTAERCLPRAEKLRTQATRLEHLIEGILDVFSLGRGPLQISREELELGQVARRIVERFRTESKQSNATITLQAEPSVGDWDRQRLEQILTQLVSNAVKFGAGQPIDVLIGGSAETARIVVRDRGIGVAPEAQERIFGRFVRLAPTSQYGGLGLGLWIVRELAGAMGGTVRVESKPGDGASFIVELPRTQ
jgi:signal transduction histidine kinase